MCRQSRESIRASSFRFLLSGSEVSPHSSLPFATGTCCSGRTSSGRKRTPEVWAGFDVSFCRSLHVLGAGWPVACYLDGHRLISRPGEVRHVRGLGIETAWRQRFELLFVEAQAVTDIPGSGDDSRDAI